VSQIEYLEVPFPADGAGQRTYPDLLIPQQLFNRYLVYPNAQLVATSVGELLAFGDEAEALHVGVLQQTGQIATVPFDLSRAPTVINTSIHTFTACVKATYARYPFFGIEDETMFVAMADELRSVYIALDPLTIAEYETLWDSFCSDLLMGDYNTEQMEGRAPYQQGS
jgi:hypothetical protein